MIIVYIGMRGSKVNVGVVRIGHSTTLAVRVIGSGQVAKIASSPSIDAEGQNDSHKNEVDNQAATIGTISPLN